MGMIHHKVHQKGITLLITLLLTSVLLAITASLLNITLKQFQISGIARQSEIAFQAANAGIECALYHDNATDPSPFEVPGDGSPQGSAASITCMGDGPVVNSKGNGLAASGDEQAYEFEWGSPAICTKVSIYKFKDDSGNVDIDVENVTRTCGQGYECTVIASRGYNNPCSQLDNTRTVERELIQVY